MKFKNGLIRYAGIAVFDLAPGEEDLFSFQILEPEENKGMTITIDWRY